MENRTLPLAAVGFSLALWSLGGCGGSNPAAPHDDDHGHAHGEGDHEHAEGEHSGHDHAGAVIALGEAVVGAFNVRATRDDGQIVAGGDAPIDVTVTPVEGSGARVAAVRFWIGVESGAGSVKARAEIENPAEPNRWHTHAEVPSPLPEGSRLWVEIETERGEVSVGGFDLAMTR